MPDPSPLRHFRGTPAKRFWAVALLIFCVSPYLHAEKVANLTTQGYVNDFAGVLSAAGKESLTALCIEVDQKTKAQIAVVTVSSLEGESVEQFSLDLATKWGVGPKQDSRGVMILVATTDHKYRIEVGYGLEPILPDGKVGAFGREAVPLLRQGDYDGAILLMTGRVAGVIADEQKATLDSLSGVPPAPQAGPEPIAQSRPNLLWIVFLLFFIFFPVLSLILRTLFGGVTGRRGGRWMGGGGFGGGSWGGGGGGGGGFGGFGGGSFGGGGSSGGW